MKSTYCGVFLLWIAACFVLPAPVNAAPGHLTVQKEKLTSGDCHSPTVGNPNPTQCTFMINIRNNYHSAYSGPVTISDQVFDIFNAPAAGSVTILSVSNGWNCSTPTGTSFTCSHPNLTIQPGMLSNFSVILDMVNVTPGSPPGSNCARVLIPQVNNLSTGCVSIGVITGQIEVSKSFSPHSDMTNPGPFLIQMQCNLPANNVSSFALPSAGTNSPAVPVGSQCTLSEMPPTAPLPNGCMWDAPAYPNGNVAAVSSSGPATGQLVTIQNSISCGPSIGNPVSVGNPVIIRKPGGGKKEKPKKPNERK